MAEIAEWCVADFASAQGTVTAKRRLNMPERELKKKPEPQQRESEADLSPAVAESGTKIKAELDDLLDEIDEVLETNAEEFVKSYIQKGGQ